MNQSSKKIRVRYAPSPTGYIHVGNFRTALYNYLLAKKNNADFILRIEDTDRSRYVEGAVENLVQTLKKMNISWNEGIFMDKATKDDTATVTESTAYPKTFEVGEHGPYVQSERLEIYKKYAQQLVNEGKAYYCFCDSERLEKMRKEQLKEGRPPMYDKNCLYLSNEELRVKKIENKPFVIRLKVPENKNIQFDDIVRGKVSFNTNTIDDQVLLKSDGFPTYHLASVVDDHLMNITHVIRGEEWLPSTPKHILLYEAFGWEIPQFAHLPLLLNPDKTKLSKRQGDVAVEDYLKKGYLKEGIINFVALLGWNPGGGSTKEIFTLEELIKEFDLKKVHKAGAVFDVKKLDWINSQHIKKLSLDQMYEHALPFLEMKELYFGAPEERQKPEYVKKVLKIEQERISKFEDVGDDVAYLLNDIKYEKELLKWKEMSREELKESLSKSKEVFESLNDKKWTLKEIEKELLEAAGDNRGNLLWPLRVSLSGQQKSPSPFELAWVLGKEEAIKRIEHAINIL